MIKEGDKAPDFALPDGNGDVVKLADLKGQKVALYFYPKDDTPGCTKQACSIRDNDTALKDAGIRVLGVSLDDAASHQAFAAKFNLPFTLLSDLDHSVSEAYGVYGEQRWGDKTYMGLARKTFLIDENGNIKKVFDKVNVEQHASEVMDAFNQ